MPQLNTKQIYIELDEEDEDLWGDIWWWMRTK
jgi:hypothetical protein